MKKIYIIGIVASGKSTLANKLSQIQDVKHYEVDAIVHKKINGIRVKQSYEEQVAELKKINKIESWIIEGTYRPSCDYVLENAERIVFVDPPLYIRKYRIIKRFIKQNLKIEKCHYKPDLEMLKAMFKWTRDFEKNRTDFEDMLNCYSEKLIVIKTLKEYQSFR